MIIMDFVIRASLVAFLLHQITTRKIRSLQHMHCPFPVLFTFRICWAGQTFVLAAQKKEGEKERSQYYVITAVPHFEEWPRDQIKWMMMMWWDPGIGADWKGSFQNSFARSNLVNFDFYRSTVYYTPCLFWRFNGKLLMMITDIKVWYFAFCSDCERN